MKLLARLLTRCWGYLALTTAMAGYFLHSLGFAVIPVLSLATIGDFLLQAPMSCCAITREGKRPGYRAVAVPLTRKQASQDVALSNREAGRLLGLAADGSTHEVDVTDPFGQTHDEAEITRLLQPRTSLFGPLVNDSGGRVRVAGWPAARAAVCREDHLPAPARG